MSKYIDDLEQQLKGKDIMAFTKEIKDDLNRKMLQKEADLNLSQVIQGKYKRRGY